MHNAFIWSPLELPELTKPDPADHKDEEYTLPPLFNIQPSLDDRQAMIVDYSDQTSLTPPQNIIDTFWNIKKGRYTAR